MKRLLALLATGASTVGLTVLAGPPAQAATGGAAEYTITNQWEGGFQAGVKITNLGDPVSGWTSGSRCRTPDRRSSRAGTRTWSQSGSRVTAGGADWNRTLSTGASADLGFVGSFTGSNPAPTSFRSTA